MEISDYKSLNENDNDALAGTIKSVVGLIPIMGSYINDIVNDLIPNQRIDRIAEYCKKLGEKLDTIPVEKLNKILENPIFLDLLEEGFIQASRALSNERKEYIANIVYNGILNDVQETSKSKYILLLLNELNDEEIVILHYHYYEHNPNKQKELMEVNSQLLSRKFTTFDMNEEERIEVALHTSYIEHLKRLGLIEQIIEKNNLTKEPVIDNFGKFKVRRIGNSTLGCFMLKQLGLTNSIYPFDEHFKVRINEAKKTLINFLELILEDENSNSNEMYRIESIKMASIVDGLEKTKLTDSVTSCLNDYFNSPGANKNRLLKHKIELIEKSLKF